jgi:hypothetical protein
LTIVFTFEAGVQWFEAYEAAKQHRRVIVGGLSARGSVGAAGGWLQGGGHSALSPSYGLGNAKIPVTRLRCLMVNLYRRRQRLGNINCDRRR